MENEWIRHDYRDECPIDGEQRVEVKWRDGSTTKHRAGVFNWDMIREYRLMPNPVHSV